MQKITRMLAVASRVQVTARTGHRLHSVRDVGGALTLRTVDTGDGLDALAADWHRLTDAGIAADATDTADAVDAARVDAAAATDIRTDTGIGRGTGIFNGWSWNRTWWSHYRHLGTLQVLVLESGGVVRGIAPFYRTTTRLLRVANVSTLRLIGSGGDTSPDDLDVLAERGWHERVAVAVAAHLLGPSGFARLDLHDVPETSVFAAALLREAARGGHVAPRIRTLTRPVDTLPASVEAWRASLSRNARKQRKRRHNRLADAGECAFTLCATPEEVTAGHAALVRLHHARRGSFGEAGSFRSPEYLAFHLALMQALLARGELRLGVLAIAGEPVAVEYAFMAHGTLAFFQSGFDPEHARLAPAHLLMHWMIEEAIAAGAVRIDLLKGDYEYKRAFASGTRTTRTIDLCTHRTLARAIGLVQGGKSVLGRLRAGPRATSG